MGARKVSDEDVIRVLKATGSPTEAAKILGLSERQLYSRRHLIEEKHGISLPAYANKKQKTFPTLIPEDRKVIKHYVENGVVLVGSDAHYWPGEPSVAHQAFVKLAKEIKPHTIVINGDLFDGARISKHDPLFGAKSPTVKQEIEACQERTSEIEDASKNSKLFLTYGNHDIRLWRYCYLNAPELVGLDGLDLFSHFGRWHHGWRLDINDSTIIKHRWHGGVHAGYNNAMKSFLRTSKGSAAMVTGHLHRLICTPFRGESGVAYGVDTGTLADIGGDQFHYMEANPSIGASGFAVLTFKDGMLLPPELCEVINGVAYFRGQEL